jgi:hypothetical protein
VVGFTSFGTGSLNRAMYEDEDASRVSISATIEGVIMREPVEAVVVLSEPGLCDGNNLEALRERVQE